MKNIQPIDVFNAVAGIAFWAFLIGYIAPKVAHLPWSSPEHTHCDWGGCPPPR